MSDTNFFNSVDSRPNYGEITEELVQFWKDNKTFEKSVEMRPEDNQYVFYDGPPFVTGLPHYGSLLPSIAKDLVPRYWTMKGKRVERVWGWDCHGLPVENKVEKEMGLNSRRDIEKVGLDQFIPKCQAYVSNVSSEWQWYIDRVGRWVDFDNAYRTMDQNFMESVWWVFKQIYEKDLIYQGKRVSLYCPRCGTPISNFEVAMDNSYKDVTEVSNTYKYRIKNEELKIKNVDPSAPLFILAWSTTPWNKLATPALAINPKFTYVVVKQNDEFYILAKTTLESLKDDPYEIVAELSGTELEDVHFEPHYDFYDIDDDKQAWVIVGGDFVSDDAGTGVVTLAVYGEDDFKVMQEKNVVMLEHVDGEGHIRLTQSSKLKTQNRFGNAAKFDGLYYLKANKIVNADLTERGLMYSEKELTHSVPECWRCSTRLMHAPQNAWFIAISKMRDQLLQSNEDIYWFPNHLKEGRFKRGIESAPDWCISRSRYWATPMPVWECHRKCGNRTVIGSRDELEKLSGKPVTDMHRPYIDEHTFECSECGSEMRRVSDVLDSWMDAGSMPYAQRHYPFENKEAFDASFPGDYIIEYIAQTRAWFYVMHVISNALFGTNSFKNVICTGVISGTDGRKMSKSYGNYPDPKRVIQTYGGDALRLYMMSSPVMAAENMNLNEDEIKEQNQRVLSILWNSYKYFVTYANMHQWKPSAIYVAPNADGNLLDRWILVKLNQFKQDMSKFIEEYNLPKATRLIRPFTQDLSTWYIRRSRDRFVDGDSGALETMYFVLLETAKVIAPTLPFMSEKMYQNLKTEDMPESVHLCDWPDGVELTDDDRQMLEKMILTRDICSLGNDARKKAQIPVRQPLHKVVCRLRDTQLSTEYLEIIKDELNVKEVQLVNVDSDLEVDLDLNLTQALKDEGEARKLIRKIQEARKKAGTQMSDMVVVTLPEWPSAFEEEIMKKALVKEIKKGEKVDVVG